MFFYQMYVIFGGEKQAYIFSPYILNYFNHKLEMITKVSGTVSIVNIPIDRYKSFLSIEKYILGILNSLLQIQTLLIQSHLYHVLLCFVLFQVWPDSLMCPQYRIEHKAAITVLAGIDSSLIVYSVLWTH